MPQGRRGLLGCVAMACAVASGRADVVAVKGQPPMVSVTLARLEKGQLSWRTQQGTLLTRPVEQVEYLQVVGWPLFNLAEKQMRDRSPQQACLAYERAIEELRKPDKARPTADGVDPNLLLNWRLCAAAQANRQFDRAVRAWLVLALSGDAESWLALQPRTYPSAHAPELTEAARVVDEAIATHAGESIATILQTWRARWPVSTSQPAATTEPALPDLYGDAVTRDALLRVQQLLVEKKMEPALQSLREIHAKASGLARAEAFYLEAQAYWLRSLAGAPEARVDRRRAGLAAMRVVIHFPESPRTPQALLLAGRMCRDDGNADGARALWSEAVSRYSATLPAVQQARQELNTLPTATRPSG